MAGRPRRCPGLRARHAAARGQEIPSVAGGGWQIEIIVRGGAWVLHRDDAAAGTGELLVGAWFRVLDAVEERVEISHHRRRVGSLAIADQVGDRALSVSGTDAAKREAGNNRDQGGNAFTSHGGNPCARLPPLLDKKIDVASTPYDC